MTWFSTFITNNLFWILSFLYCPCTSTTSVSIMSCLTAFITSNLFLLLYNLLRKFNRFFIIVIYCLFNYNSVIIIYTLYIITFFHYLTRSFINFRVKCLSLYFYYCFCRFYSSNWIFFSPFSTLTKLMLI